MNASDLETYEYQLSQIKLALAKDPKNEEFITLKDELESLIELTKEYLTTQSGSSSTIDAHHTTSSSTSPGTTSKYDSTAKATARALSSSSRTPTQSEKSPTQSDSTDTSKVSMSSVNAPHTASARKTHQFQPGDDCLARFSGDGKFYPARITTIGGSDDNRVFSIVFHGYETTEIVALKDLKPSTSPEAEKKKRGDAPDSVKELDADKERKRKKYEKKAETQASKAQEQGLKQKSWQQFAKKSTKKGVVIPGVSGGSMFRSPEDLNPQGRVGVIGSGRASLKAPERRKQVFGGDGS